MIQKQTPQTHYESDEFLPNLCSVQGVFGLVLVGELLSMALVLADGGLAGFHWYQLGLVSLLVEWIVLFSAACLCRLSPWLNRQSAVVAGSSSYAVVLSVTLAFSALGQLLVSRELRVDGLQLVTNFLLAALVAGVMLRYLFLQQQLRNQQQAELQARLQALQSRIHPHFLFNSMNSIASLIHSQPEVAERMVEDLSGLFRASLSEPGMIPLERELDLCRRFVRIEQLRLGDRLQVRWHIPEVLPAETQVPSLLLQPLLENAIYHGVQPRAEGGEVVVSLMLEVGGCSVTISNPLPQGDGADPGHGLALNNIRHRLAAYYGGKGEMIMDADDEKFTVCVRFPVELRK